MNGFPVVCVGGSAGGIDAYIRLLKHLPPDMGRGDRHREAHHDDADASA